jgi:hypothetical protein
VRVAAAPSPAPMQVARRRSLTAREIIERQLSQPAPVRIFRSSLMSGAEASAIQKSADDSRGVLIATSDVVGGTR